MEGGAPKGGILKRAARNAGLLLGGKASAGAMQLGTFALAARGLGVHDFGVFSVVTAQVLLLTGLAAFDSNQAIIRYGVGHLNSGDRAAMQSLFKAGTLLDIGAATVAAIAVVFVAPLLAQRLQWGPDLVLLAQCAAPLAFANAVATPKGMLRLFGRFDLLSVQSIVTPAIRLALFAALTLAGATLAWYLAAWLVAGWTGAVVAYVVAWREAARHGLLAGMNASLRGLTRANPGMWRFAILSNLNSSVALIPTQLAVLIVAWLLGPAAAGIFRIARETATGLMKPVELMNQALYPDLARLVAARDWRRATRAAVRAGAAASAVGALVAILIWLAGPTILRTVFGPGFVPAAPILVAIGIGTSIRVSAFAADPLMFALGRPGTPLMLGALSTALFVAVLVWRLPIDGLAGAGYAFVAMGAAGAALSATAAARRIGIEREADTIARHKME